MSEFQFAYSILSIGPDVGWEKLSWLHSLSVWDRLTYVSLDGVCLGQTDLREFGWCVSGTD
ncbi:MAG: hypothetical protein Aurels2KO_05230 [Aureliella sp.]